MLPRDDKTALYEFLPQLLLNSGHFIKVEGNGQGSKGVWEALVFGGRKTCTGIEGKEERVVPQNNNNNVAIVIY